MAARDLFFRRNEGQGPIGLRCLSDLRDGVGQGRVRSWIPPISFRIRESAENFDENLKLASFSGGTYEVTREDGLKDVIYSQLGQRPCGSRNRMGDGEFSNIIRERKSATMRMLLYPFGDERLSLCLA